MSSRTNRQKKMFKYIFNIISNRVAKKLNMGVTYDEHFIKLWFEDLG